MSRTPNEQPPAKKRRWLQFSLRTALLLVAAIGVWLGWNLYVVRQRRELLRSLREDAQGQAMTVPESIEYHKALIGRVDFVLPEIPIWRRWLGDEPIERISVGQSDAENVERLANWFPEAIILRPSKAVDMFSGEEGGQQESNPDDLFRKSPGE